MRTRRRKQRKGPDERGIQLLRLPSGLVRYRVQLGGRGKGNRRSRLCKSLQEALALKQEWTERGLPPAGAPSIASRDVIATLDDGLRHRVLDLEQRGKDASVTERIRVFLKHYWPEGADLPLSSVNIATIEEYRDRRFRTPTGRRRDRCADNTVIRELRELRACLKQVRPDFKVPANVFPQENLTRVRMLTPEEYSTVFPYLAERFGETFADLSQLALVGVMRQADVRLLQRKHVHLGERLLLLPHTKGGKPRAVRLSDKAIEIVTRAMARHPESPYVFPNPRSGQPYSRIHVSRCWRIAARECGLHDFTFHDLRHHGPTVAANAGASDAILQAMGGWQSTKMVRRYASILDPTLDKYLDQIGQ